MKIARSLIAIAIALTLIFSTFLISFAEDFAKDVPVGYWGRDAIKALNDSGIMQGSGGFFRPEDKITRVEYFALINRAFSFTSAEGAAAFSDVDYSKNDWKVTAVKCASAQGYLKGSNGKASPDSNITREEAFVILARVFSVSASSSAAGFKDDSSISSWASGEIAAMKESGYISGSNGYINPKNNLKRAEAAQVLVNITGGVFMAPYTVSKDCAFDLAGYTGPLGLTANGSKVLYKGKEFRGIGFDYYDGFIQLFETGKFSDEIIKANFKKMKDNNIPYIRMNLSPFWPINYREYYAADKKKFFSTMDMIIRAAEDNGIGIIGTLFWNSLSTTDFCDEPYTEWGNPGSKTRAFMAEYVKELVGRYKNSPAIWGWEFSNELNLACDLPNAAEFRNNSIIPSLGTRLTRDERDDMTTEVLSNAMKAFAAEVRKYDKTRIISTGNAGPRGSAYNMYDARSWKTDSKEEMEQILALQNPAECETLSVHIYEDEKRYDAESSTVEGAIKAVKEACDKMNRPMFLGEFSGDVTGFGLDTVKKQFTRVFNAAVANQVPLVCVWSAWSNPSRLKDNILQSPDLDFIVKTVGQQNTKTFTELGIKLWK